jgi:predicted ferric reductase
VGQPTDEFDIKASNEVLNRTLKDLIMLYTIAVVLVVLWLLGLVTAYTLGGFIHILLVVAVIVLLLRVIRGTKVL